MTNEKIILTTGGSGGHIIPAIVLAKKLQKEKIEVLIIGDNKIKSYLEQENLNYKIISSGYNLKSIKSLWNIFKGFVKSLFIVCKYRPNIVIGFGSYTTLPILLAAKLFKKTIILHEQNSHIGKINKFFSNSARYIFTSFYEMYGIKIENAAKIEFTGNPIRKEIKELYLNDYIVKENEDNFNILITGGSGGASFFSKELIKIFNYFDKSFNKKLIINHQVKEKEEIDFVEEFYHNIEIKANVKIFFADMPTKIKEADLVISRSGAGVSAELSIAGKPTIFIPSPNVVNNHQYHNAEFYLKNNACILLEEKNFKEKEFSLFLKQLILNKETLKNLSKNIKKLAIIDAEDKMYFFVNKILKEK